MPRHYYSCMRHIYLDNAATTPTDPRVFMSMKPYFLIKYGNASEFHSLGREAKVGIEKSRKAIAGFFKASPDEIIFCGSATESINLAIKGLIDAVGNKRNLPHIITSSVEHKAVLETCKHLEEKSLAQVTYLPVDKYGRIRIADLKKCFRKNTVLVSIMYVNNEVGTLEPIKDIGKIITRENNRRLKDRLSKIYFHTDATQAVQFLNCNVNSLGLDMLSFSGHKIYAPKGIGALYVRNSTPLRRQVDGGGQERNLRAGTENVAYIVGLGRTIELVLSGKGELTRRLKSLQKRVVVDLCKIPGVRLTGHPRERAPHICSFVVDRVEGEAMVLLLSQTGIMISSGSACTSDSLSPSHVLSAMGVKPKVSHGSVRISLGKSTSVVDVEKFIVEFKKAVFSLRKMAPKL